MAPDAGEQPDAGTAAVAGGDQSPHTSDPGTGTGIDPGSGTGIEPGTDSGTGTSPDTGTSPGPDVVTVDPEPGSAVDALVEPTG